MQILQCLNDTETQLLNCESSNGISSTCVCCGKIFENRIQFDVNNTDLYTNFGMKGVADINITNNFDNSKRAKINECFEKNDTFMWDCKTNGTNLNQTFCFCYSHNQDISLDGYIHTKSLYKGLENLTFPVHKENILNDSSQTGDNWITKISSKDENQNQLLKTELTIKASIIVSLFILTLLFIYWIFKRKIYKKCYKLNDDKVNLISEIELDILN